MRTCAILSIIIFSFCGESKATHGFEILLKANQKINFEDFNEIEITYFSEVFRKFIEEQKKENKTVSIDFKVEGKTKIGFVKAVKEILKEYNDFIILTVHPAKGSPTKVKLPPKSNENPDIYLNKLKGRNLLVLILTDDKKLYRDTINQQNEITSEIKFLAKEFLKSDTNNINFPILTIKNLPEIGNIYCADRSIIVLKSEYDTQFSFYDGIYQELRSAYQEIWEENSLFYFQESYRNLSTNRQKIIKTIHPYVLSEFDSIGYE